MGMCEDGAGQKEDLIRVLLGLSVLLATRRGLSRLKWEITFAKQFNNRVCLKGNPNHPSKEKEVCE